MANEQAKPRLRIPRERGIPVGRFELDYRAIWAVALGGTSLIIFALAANAGVWWAGFLFAIGTVIVYSLAFQAPGAAFAHRYGGRWLRGLLGSNVHTSSQPEVGEDFGSYASEGKRPKAIPLIGRVDFLPHEMAEGVLGVAHDRRYGTYSISMWAAGSSLLSANESTQLERLRAFAGLLDSLAESGASVHRFAWHEQTLVGEPQRPAETVETIRRTTDLLRENPPNQAVLLERTSEMGERSEVHKTTMTISILADAVKREAKALGKSHAGFAEVLRQRAEAINALAMGAEYGSSPIGLKGTRIATYNDLVLENRLVLDPVFAQPVYQEWQRPDDREYRLDEQDAWPGYVNFQPAGYCQLGDTFHMGFYIQEFTRAGMPPNQLWNILKLRIPKTVTLVFQMVPARRAQRFAEWSTSGASASNVDRARSNRRVTASQQQAAKDALAHETEMATYQGQVGRIRCYIDLTGASLEEVRHNASLLRYACADARFLVEPLTGRQHLGIQAAMPIGRGLSSLTESWQWLNK